MRNVGLLKFRSGMIRFKAGVGGDKRQADRVAGAVALFGDNQLRLIELIRIGISVIQHFALGCRRF